MSDDDIYPFKVSTSITRGTCKDDRDEFDVDVAAQNIDELDTKLEQARERLKEHAREVRAIQPNADDEIDENQSRLDDVDREQVKA